MAEVKHFHKLKKHRYDNGNEIFFCVLNCNFKIEAALAVGKIVLCNICEEPFALNEYSVRLNRPHCQNCGRVEIKDPISGKKKYIRKRSGTIIRDIAADEVNTLRAKLDVLVNPVDEDI